MFASKVSYFWFVSLLIVFVMSSFMKPTAASGNRVVGTASAKPSLAHHAPANARSTLTSSGKSYVHA